MGLLSADSPRDTAIAWGFVVVQAALIVAIAVLPGGDDWVAPGWLAGAGRGAQVVGLAFLGLGLLGLGRSLTALPTPVDHGELRTGGVYRLVRHPIYTGILALGAGATVRSGSATMAVAVAALAGWFWLKARWEEGHLHARYPGYADYAARTPRFVPGWRRHA